MMKKTGFTLTETLITLSIIGIAAALIAPSLRKLIPDREKIEFMETYKLVTNALPIYNAGFENDVSFSDGKIIHKVGWAGNRVSEAPFFKDLTNNKCVEPDIITKSNDDDSDPIHTYIYMSGGSIKCGEAEFTLDRNGTIIRIEPPKYANYLKDQFNYYKKSDEDED